MREFIMMVGFPGSGKSTVANGWVKGREDTHRVFSSDELRKELGLFGKNDQRSNQIVFDTLQERLISWLRDTPNGTAIYDATNLSRSNRVDLLKKIDDSGIRCYKRCAWLDPPREICMKQNAERDGLERVPDFVYDKMDRYFAPPDESEGFDDICKWEKGPIGDLWVIYERDIDIDETCKLILSDGCLKLIDILEKRGSSGFIVGGAVRDMILYGPTHALHDEDITTRARIDEIKEILSSEFPDGSVRFIDKGGEKYGITVVSYNDKEYEIATFRKDGEYDKDRRHPEQIYEADTIEDDLSRRDLTINAMAWSPSKGLVDPFGGQRDIKNRLIRAVGDPDKRFEEDPLRMLRAVRFAVALGFDIEKKTMKSIQRNVDMLSRCSKERIGEELWKMMSKDVHNIELLHTSGLLKVISPELDRMFYCDQNNPYHYTDVGHHTCQVMESAHIPDVRLAALLHDVGKPVVKTQNLQGRDSFIGHPKESEKIAREFLRKYRFPEKKVEHICSLVEHHDDLSRLYETKNPWKSIRKFLVSNQDRPDNFFIELLDLKSADWWAHDPKSPDHDKIDKSLKYLLTSLGPYIEEHCPRKISDLDINGNELSLQRK